MGNVNGQELQHATAAFSLNDGQGAPEDIELESIDYKDGAEKEGVNDGKGKQVAYVIKPQKTSGSMALRNSVWNAIEKVLTQRNPEIGIGQIEMDLTITFGNSFQELKTHKLYGVMFNDLSVKSGKDQAYLVTEKPFFFLRAVSIVDGVETPFVNYDTL